MATGADHGESDVTARGSIVHHPHLACDDEEHVSGRAGTMQNLFTGTIVAPATTLLERMQLGLGQGPQKLDAAQSAALDLRQIRPYPRLRPGGMRRTPVCWCPCCPAGS